MSETTSNKLICAYKLSNPHTFTFLRVLAPLDRLNFLNKLDRYNEQECSGSITFIKWVTVLNKLILCKFYKIYRIDKNALHVLMFIITGKKSYDDTTILGLLRSFGELSFKENIVHILFDEVTKTFRILDKPRVPSYTNPYDNIDIDGNILIY